MFQKKTWKRGDKLTVSELNRIEKGIDEKASEGSSINSNSTTITFDIITNTDNNEASYSVENLSLSVSQIIQKFKNNEDLKIIGHREKEEDIENYIFTIFYYQFNKSNSDGVIIAKSGSFELVFGIDDNEPFVELQKEES